MEETKKSHESPAENSAPHQNDEILSLRIRYQLSSGRDVNGKDETIVTHFRPAFRSRLALKKGKGKLTPAYETLQ